MHSDVGGALARRLATVAALTAALPGWGGAAHAQTPARRADSARTERVARALLRRLEGAWVFEWRRQDRALAFTGTRTYRLLSDSLRLTWDEAVDRTRQAGHGVLWYHPGTRRVLYAGAYAPSGAGVILAGRLARSGDAVTFDPVPIREDSLPVNEGLVRSALRVPAGGAHTWARYDGAWVVTFRRRP